jgi:hypothetical protein
VTPCSGAGDSTTWCCGGENTTCCGQAGAITIAATLGPSVSPTSTSNGTALPVVAEAVIGVGVSLAGLSILAGIIWFVLRMRWRRRGRVDRSGRDNYFGKSELDANTQGDWRSEEAANDTELRLRYELDGKPTSELPAG